jgi:hypothetical protein
MRSQSTTHSLRCRRRSVACCPTKSFTIGGEALTLGLEDASRFEELSHWEAARTAIHYAFDLIEHARAISHSWTGRLRWCACCAIPRPGIMFNEPRTGLLSSRTPAGSALRTIVSRKIDGTYRSSPCRVGVKVRNAASIAVQRDRSKK